MLWSVGFHRFGAFGGDGQKALFGAGSGDKRIWLARLSRLQRRDLLEGIVIGRMVRQRHIDAFLACNSGEPFRRCGIGGKILRRLCEIERGAAPFAADMAMAADVTSKLWEMSDMVKVLEDWERANER
jgi:hypothetical protein